MMESVEAPVDNPMQNPVANKVVEIELRTTSDSTDDPDRESRASRTSRDSWTDVIRESIPVSLESALLNKASPFSCYACLTNTIMGGGILGLPFAMAGAGWAVGLTLMILCSTSSVFALHELSVCAALTEKPASFYSVAMKGIIDIIIIIFILYILYFIFLL